MLNSLPIHQGSTRLRILVIDASVVVRLSIKNHLENIGHFIAEARDVDEAQRAIETTPPQLVILDINLPNTSGLLQRLSALAPDVTTIIMSELSQSQSAIETIQFGAYGFLSKPFDSTHLSVSLRTALRRRQLELEAQVMHRQLEQTLHEQTLRIRRSHEEIAARLISTITARDGETGAHIRRIGAYAQVIAIALGWGELRSEQLRIAATMHDIGEIAIPDSILRKRTSLNEEERLRLQDHTEIGARMLSGSPDLMLQMAERIARCHHEYFNGQGYPQGLSGEEIPLEARIVCICDTYDSLLHAHGQKPALDEAQALELLCTAYCQRFDPALFEVFLQNIDAIRLIRARYLNSAPPAPRPSLNTETL